MSKEDAEWIGTRIYRNECSSDADKLLWWNAGEEFASLGIAHFIWYPEGKTGPYRETFPHLIAYLKRQEVAIPAILEPFGANPWPTRSAFLKEKNSSYSRELRTFLKNTIPQQTAFLVESFENALSLLLSSYPEEMRGQIQEKITAIACSKEGRYALLDYANFKGDGTLETERYQGKGWGLKQVLEEMPAHSDNSVAAFVETAKKVLERRVANAPSEREEQRWLPGWISRLNTYL
ncbi:MAG: hypothetical protein V4492_05935 [Chlamydiota bacterium]